jgi:hypothetical protein
MSGKDLAFQVKHATKFHFKSMHTELLTAAAYKHVQNATHS